MKCPACNRENRTGAHFCQDCGQDLSGYAPTTRQLDSGHPHSTLSLHPLPEGDAPDTQPLPELAASFAPLPRGAVVGNRYVIIQVVTTEAHRNVYLVKDLIPPRACANCGALTLDPGEQFCAACGVELTNAAPAQLRYVVEERPDPRAFAVEEQLLGLRLEHPGLLLPVTLFREAPYGPERRYRVQLEELPPPASSFPLPQPPERVCSWGVDLATALAHLHRHQVTLGAPTLDDVVIDEERARWSRFTHAAVIPPQARNHAQPYQSQDVQALARLLVTLLTGREALRAGDEVPEQVHALLDAALRHPDSLTAAQFGAELKNARWTLQQPQDSVLLVGRKSDAGQVRALNEDSLLTLDLPEGTPDTHPVGVYVVADGMGGHEAGDVASQITCQTIEELTRREIIQSARTGERLPSPEEWLTHAAQAANEAVLEERRAAHSDMGTTLVMAYLRSAHATIANVGDSRCYHLAPAGIRQLTVDHSLVERLVASGQLTREEAAIHPQRNVIYRVIGDRSQLQVDLFEQQLRPQEALLLCSDGLSGMVSDEQLWELWREAETPQQACDRMVTVANEAGGEDNITVIIVQIATR